MPIDFAMLAQQCAPSVHPTTLRALVKTESGFNPYAIGVVGGKLMRQPRNRDEAIATVRALDASGWNYSMGLTQINRGNLRAYDLSHETAFDPCANLRAGGAILSGCYDRALAGGRTPQAALRAALSCYYSGNFTRGFVPDSHATSYVERVVANAARVNGGAESVPPIDVVPTRESPAPIARPRREPVPRDSAGPGQHKPIDQHPAWDALGDF